MVPHTNGGIQVGLRAALYRSPITSRNKHQKPLLASPVSMVGREVGAAARKLIVELSPQLSIGHETRNRKEPEGSLSPENRCACTPPVSASPSAASPRCPNARHQNVDGIANESSGRFCIRHSCASMCGHIAVPVPSVVVAPTTLTDRSLLPLQSTSVRCSVLVCRTRRKERVSTRRQH